MNITNISKDKTVTQFICMLLNLMSPLIPHLYHHRPSTIMQEEAVWPSGLGHWSCNPEVLGLRPPPCHQRDLFRGSPKFKSSITLCKQPTGRAASCRLGFLTIYDMLPFLCFNGMPVTQITTSLLSKTVHNTPVFIVYSQCPSLMYLPTPSNVTSSNNCSGFSFCGKASSLDGGFNLDSNFSRKPIAAAIFP